MTWPRWINVIFGIWLLAAPVLLRYVDANAWANDRLLGILIVVATLIAASFPPVRSVNVGLGVWLVVAPFVLHYEGSRAIANDIVVGIAVALFALVPSRPAVRGTTGEPGGLS